MNFNAKSLESQSGQALEPSDIRNFLDKLEPTKEKGKFICPVCGGKNLSISPKTGAYQCFSGGCDSKEIWRAIAPPAINCPPSSRPIKALKSAKQKAKDKEIASAHIESEVDHLLHLIRDGIQSQAESEVELANFCKEEGYSQFAASRLFLERLKQRGIGATTEKEKDRFENTHEGLKWIGWIRSGKSVRKAEEIIGDSIDAIAYIDSIEGDSAAILLEFKTQRGLVKRWAMPRELLAGDGAAIISELLKRGYSLSYENRTKLFSYLIGLGRGIERFYRISDRTGWVESSFLLPNTTIGDQSLRYRQVEPISDSGFEVRGTAQSWAEAIGAQLAGNSRLIFAVGVAFASPLAPLLNIEGGGFHLVGGTSQGKSTALAVAASVIGLPLASWNTTVNGLESVATAHNHLLLPIDEIGEAGGRDIGAAAYILANGQGKSRMGRDLNRRLAKKWTLLTLSTGELGIGAYLKQAGIAQKGGQEIRFPDIPAVPPGNPNGLIEKFHQYGSAKDFVEALRRLVQENQGAVFQEFLTKLIADRTAPTWLPEKRERLRAIATHLTGNLKDAAIGRAANRFALVWVGLEIAHGYGLLPFPAEQIEWAISSVFGDWIKFRGGAISPEVKAALEKIELLFVSQQHGDRIFDLDNPRLDSSGKPLIRNLLAYRKGGQEPEFLVPAAVFKAEFSVGTESRELITELQRRGWLLGPGTDGKAALFRWIGSKSIRAYVFRAFWEEKPDLE
jgi:putative DNA primase/helicase